MIAIIHLLVAVLALSVAVQGLLILKIESFVAISFAVFTGIMGLWNLLIFFLKVGVI